MVEKLSGTFTFGIDGDYWVSQVVLPSLEKVVTERPKAA
jgi:hypothetical protein